LLFEFESRLSFLADFSFIKFCEHATMQHMAHPISAWTLNIQRLQLQLQLQLLFVAYAMGYASICLWLAMRKSIHRF